MQNTIKTRIASALGFAAIIAVIGFMTLPLAGCNSPADPPITTVDEKTLTGIEITTGPTKTVYYIGESLDLAGMVVTATYSDGTTAPVTDFTTSGFDPQTPGQQTVTVSYEGKTATFTVTVNENVGENKVGGKTYYISSHKIVFAASTGRSGSYTGYWIRYASGGGYDLDGDGKYQWDADETGTYTWNEGAKTATLQPETRAGPDGSLLDKAGFKAAYNVYMTEMLAAYQEENDWTQEELDAYIQESLASMGFSSLAQYIDAMVNEGFSIRSFTYSFSTDGNSLLLQENLPQPKGTDELYGKTYYGTTWDDDLKAWVKYPDEVYVFGANKTYTHTYKGYSVLSPEYKTITDVGFYSYDSTQKRVYFNIVTTDGKTAAEYYDAIPNTNVDSRDINEAASRASRTNSSFCLEDYRYDPVKSLID